MFDYIELKTGYQIGHYCPSNHEWIPNPKIPLLPNEEAAMEVVDGLNDIATETEDLLMPYVNKKQIEFQF